MVLAHGIMSLWKQFKIVGVKPASFLHRLPNAFLTLFASTMNTQIHDAQTSFDAIISQASETIAEEANNQRILIQDLINN